MPMMMLTPFTPMRLTMGLSGSGQVVEVLDPRYFVLTGSSNAMVHWGDARGPLSNGSGLTGSAGTTAPTFDANGQLSASGTLQGLSMTGSATFDLSKTMTIAAVGSLGADKFSSIANILSSLAETRILGISAGSPATCIAAFGITTGACGQVVGPAGTVAPSLLNRVMFASCDTSKIYMQVANKASSSNASTGNAAGNNSLCIPSWPTGSNNGIVIQSSSIRSIVCFTHLPNVGEKTYYTGYARANFPVQLA